MKVMISLVLLVTIAGCSTAPTVGQRQISCEQAYLPNFINVVACTKAMAELDGRMANPHPLIRLYFMKGDELAEAVKSGVLTHTQARARWQDLYVRLKAQDDAQSDAALQSALSALNQSLKAGQAPRTQMPTQTNCRYVGGLLSCTSY